MILRLLLANESTIKGLIRVLPLLKMHRKWGGEKMNFRRGENFFNSNSIFDDTNVFLGPKRVHFKPKTSICNFNMIQSCPLFINSEPSLSRTVSKSVHTLSVHMFILFSVCIISLHNYQVYYGRLGRIGKLEQTRENIRSCHNPLI